MLVWAEFAPKGRGEKAVSVVNDRGGESHVPDFLFGCRSFEPKHLHACILCLKVTIEMVDVHMFYSNSCTYDSCSGFDLHGSLGGELGGRLLMSVLRDVGETYTWKLWLLLARLGVDNYASAFAGCLDRP